MTEKLFSVEAAAERLQLHTRTVLRFIREGRLRATKVGKQYRILGTDLDALAGISVAQTLPQARVTAVVDIPDVDERLLRSLTATLMGAAAGPARRDNPLSVNRASSVRDYLGSRGVSAQRVAVDGRGSREPVADNGSEQGRARNRRVEIFVAEPRAAG